MSLESGDLVRRRQSCGEWGAHQAQQVVKGCGMGIIQGPIIGGCRGQPLPPSLGRCSV